MKLSKQDSKYSTVKALFFLSCWFVKQCVKELYVNW